MYILTQKKCKKCGKTKSLSDFCKDSRNPDGRGSRCKQCHNSYGVKHYQENLDQSRERARDAQRKHYQTNPLAVINAVKKWVAKNPEKRKEFYKTDYAKHSERYKKNARKRRVIESSFCGISVEQERDLFENNPVCVYCNKKSKHMELEHIEPLSKGGVDDISNAAVSCRSCNRQKKDKSLLSFLLRRLK